MVKLDEDRRAGWGPFKLAEDDYAQEGTGEHDDEYERQARGLPTARSRRENDELLERTWESKLQTILRPGQDKFAQVYEAIRQKIFRGAMRIFSLFGWRSGRVKVCQIDKRSCCICLRDKDRYGNVP